MKTKKTLVLLGLCLLLILGMSTVKVRDNELNKLNNEYERVNQYYLDSENRQVEEAKADGYVEFADDIKNDIEGIRIKKTKPIKDKIKEVENKPFIYVEFK